MFFPGLNPSFFSSRPSYPSLLGFFPLTFIVAVDSRKRLLLRKQNKGRKAEGRRARGGLVLFFFPFLFGFSLWTPSAKGSSSSRKDLRIPLVLFRFLLVFGIGNARPKEKKREERGIDSVVFFSCLGAYSFDFLGAIGVETKTENLEQVGR